MIIRSLGVLLLVACNSAGSPTTTEPTTPTPAPVDKPAPAAPLPDQAPGVPAADLTADHACGPFSSKDFTADVGLLDNRFRVRFLPSANVEGSAASVRAIVTKGDASVFVGARELYMQGDADFAKHATKRAAFDGDYDPVTVPAKDGISIVAGLLKAAPANDELVAVAHGWFLDKSKDVLDVAVFASGVTAANLKACRLFAEKVLATVTLGPRALAYGTGAPVTTKVSYATFEYVLPADWIMSTNVGIHDFARISFRRRGVYPDGFVELQLALDSHPGDWKSPGSDDGTKAGKLFGLDVTWTKTKDTAMAGAWTVSTATKGRDHAVASIVSGNAAGRDAAIQFAESIKAK